MILGWDCMFVRPVVEGSSITHFTFNALQQYFILLFKYFIMTFMAPSNVLTYCNFYSKILHFKSFLKTNGKYTFYCFHFFFITSICALIVLSTKAHTSQISKTGREKPVFICLTCLCNVLYRAVGKSAS